MIFFTNYPLKELNTFGIESVAEEFYIAESQEDIFHFIRNHYNPEKRFLPIGGGSNVLFPSFFAGIILGMNTKGIDVYTKGVDIFVKAAAGENWESFVDFCVNNHFCGLENLSLIPGKVGAAPIQNIGAYGSEVKDSIFSVDTIEIKTGISKTFSNKECDFGYRNSVFKAVFKGKYLITSVCFKLSKLFTPNLGYGALKGEFDPSGPENPAQVSEAIKRIRRSKLPDPLLIGNAGSFFKNPTISAHHHELLKDTYPELISFPAGENFKLAAGWLIEKAGWKGRSLGNAAVHDKQALVIINKGGATGEEIRKLAAEIQKDILKLFGVALEPEVNYLF